MSEKTHVMVAIVRRPTIEQVHAALEKAGVTDYVWQRMEGPRTDNGLKDYGRFELIVPPEQEPERLAGLIKRYAHGYNDGDVVVTWREVYITKA